MQENAGKMWTKITQNTNTFTRFPFSWVLMQYSKWSTKKKEENAPVTIRAWVAFPDFVCSKGSDVVRM